MSQRIRELEDALALLQSNISTETHILLREELLSIKNSSERRPSAEPSVPGDSLAGPIDAFGTLTIGEIGEPVYFGASAGSEVRSSTDIILECDLTDLKHLDLTKCILSLMTVGTCGYLTFHFRQNQNQKRIHLPGKRCQSFSIVSRICFPWVVDVLLVLRLSSMP